jgi:hypothetical protein
MLSEHPGLLGHPRERQRKTRANVGDAQLVGGEGTIVGDQDAGGKEKASRSPNELRHRRPKSGSRNHSLPSLAFGRSLELIADANLRVQAMILFLICFSPICVFVLRLFSAVFGFSKSIGT